MPAANVSAPTDLKTIGQVAASLGRPLHKIEYIVRARGIEPAMRAGVLRLYDADGVARIAAELARVDDRATSPAGVSA